MTNDEELFQWFATRRPIHSLRRCRFIASHRLESFAAHTLLSVGCLTAPHVRPMNYAERDARRTSSSSSEDAQDRDTLEAETAATVHARAVYAALGREWRFRYRFLTVRAGILLPFFVRFFSSPGSSDSTNIVSSTLRPPS
jgi:hypothetical protein